MADPYSFELTNKIDELERLGRQLENFGNTAGLTKKCLFQINLAMDELFTNIVTYGYPDEGIHNIQFELSLIDGEVLIRIEDTGVPFDPANADIPEPEAAIENCKVGGLGLHLVRKLMDEIRYERSGAKNITTLKKKIEPSTGS